MLPLPDYETNHYISLDTHPYEIKRRMRISRYKYSPSSLQEIIAKSYFVSLKPSTTSFIVQDVLCLCHRSLFVHCCHRCSPPARWCSSPRRLQDVSKQINIRHPFILKSQKSRHLMHIDIIILSFPLFFLLLMMINHLLYSFMR